MNLIQEIDSRATVRVSINGRAMLYVVDIDTRLAARMRDAADPKQRKVHRKSVIRYARHMSEGTWQWTGVPIIVNADGAVIDGNHRCTAASEADGYIMRDAMVVVLTRSVSTKELPVDIGHGRNAGDYRTRPVRNGIAAAIIYESAGIPANGEYLGKTDAYERGAAQSSSPWIDALTELDDLCMERRGRHISAGVGAGMIRILQHGGDHAMAWLRAVASNGAIDGRIESTADAYGVYITNRRDMSGRGNLAAAAIVRAWNNYVAGRDITMIKAVPGPVPTVMRKA